MRGGANVSLGALLAVNARVRREGSSEQKMRGGGAMRGGTQARGKKAGKERATLKALQRPPCSKLQAHGGNDKNAVCAITGVWACNYLTSGKEIFWQKAPF
ncbi:hypothetical protein SLA2020_452260 [Shorea laevis]